DKIESRLLESADRFECFFGFRLRPSICPNHAAHFFHVKMFREGRRRRHCEKGEEAIQIVGSSGDEIAIPFHYVRCLTQLIQHRTAVNRINWVQLERKRSYHAEISAAASQSPKQIRVPIGAGFHKFAVCQYDIRGGEIIDAQAALAGKMADSST